MWPSPRAPPCSRGKSSGARDRAPDLAASSSACDRTPDRAAPESEKKSRSSDESDPARAPQTAKPKKMPRLQPPPLTLRPRQPDRPPPVAVLHPRQPGHPPPVTLTPRQPDHPPPVTLMPRQPAPPDDAAAYSDDDEALPRDVEVRVGRRWFFNGVDITRKDPAPPGVAPGTWKKGDWLCPAFERVAPSFFLGQKLVKVSGRRVFQFCDIEGVCPALCSVLCHLFLCAMWRMALGRRVGLSFCFGRKFVKGSGCLGHWDSLASFVQYSWAGSQPCRQS